MYNTKIRLEAAQYTAVISELCNNHLAKSLANFEIQLKKATLKHIFIQVPRSCNTLYCVTRQNLCG